MNAALRRPLVSHLLFAGAAVLTSIATFATTATPSYAATGGYQAQLAAPIAGTAKDVQNDVAWKCEGDACRGNLGTSRAEVVCARLAKKFGEVLALAAAARVIV